MNERTGSITFKGKPMSLIGPALRSGESAPDFHLTSGDLSVVNLDGLLAGKDTVMFIAVPSLDTNVCSLESQKFNARLDELPSGAAAYVVSMDLPFAQKRWAEAQQGIQLGMLSDYRDHSFGLNYGLLIEELGLLARAIVVIGKDKKVRYVEIVREVANEPDYDAAIGAVSAA
ncbi:MAG: thiol peroxidase [Candidatus Eremiobacteraeota bacterium]|nr:thiol peroxidase [Candidatus Eremiobacteraeota bacterium]